MKSSKVEGRFGEESSCHSGRRGHRCKVREETEDTMRRAPELLLYTVRLPGSEGRRLLQELGGGELGFRKFSLAEIWKMGVGGPETEDMQAVAPFHVNAGSATAPVGEVGEGALPPSPGWPRELGSGYLQEMEGTYPVVKNVKWELTLTFGYEWAWGCH